MSRPNYPKPPVPPEDDYLSEMVAEWFHSSSDAEIAELIEQAKANVSKEDRAFLDGPGEFIPLEKSEVEANVALVVRAKERAEKAHAGQKRRGNGEDYVSHPIRVATAVSEYVGAEAVAAAFLHDVVEDTVESIEDFPEHTRTIVDHLTKRPEESKDQSIQRLSDSACPEAIIIKIADRTDNLVDGRALGRKWVRGYLKGAKKILSAARANGLNSHPLTLNLALMVEELRKWAYSAS